MGLFKEIGSAMAEGGEAAEKIKAARRAKIDSMREEILARQKKEEESSWTNQVMNWFQTQTEEAKAPTAQAPQSVGDTLAPKVQETIANFKSQDQLIQDKINEEAVGIMQSRSRIPGLANSEVGRAFMVGQATDKLGRLGHKFMNYAIAGKNIPKEDIKEIDNLRKVSAYKSSDEGFSTWLNSASKLIGQQYETATDKEHNPYITGALAATTAAAAGAVSGGVGAVPAAAAGQAATLAAVANRSAIVEGGHAFLDFYGMKHGDGSNVTPKEAAFMAKAVGGINGILETAGFSQMAKLVPGLNKFAGGAIAKNPTIRTALTSWAKKWAKGAGSESLTEGLQELPGVVAGALLQDEDVVKALASPETGKQVLEVMTETFKGTALLGATGSSVSAYQDVKSIRKQRRDEIWEKTLEKLMPEGYIPPTKKPQFNEMGGSQMGNLPGQTPPGTPPPQPPSQKPSIPSVEGALSMAERYKLKREREKTSQGKVVPQTPPEQAAPTIVPEPGKKKDDGPRASDIPKFSPVTPQEEETVQEPQIIVPDEQKSVTAPPTGETIPIAPASEKNPAVSVQLDPILTPAAVAEDIDGNHTAPILSPEGMTPRVKLDLMAEEEDGKPTTLFPDGTKVAMPKRIWKVNSPKPIKLGWLTRPAIITNDGEIYEGPQVNPPSITRPIVKDLDALLESRRKAEQTAISAGVRLEDTEDGPSDVKDTGFIITGPPGTQAAGQHVFVPASMIDEKFKGNYNSLVERMRDAMGENYEKSVTVEADREAKKAAAKAAPLTPEQTELLKKPFIQKQKTRVIASLAAEGRDETELESIAEEALIDAAKTVVGKNRTPEAQQKLFPKALRGIMQNKYDESFGQSRRETIAQRAEGKTPVSFEAITEDGKIEISPVSPIKEAQAEAEANRGKKPPIRTKVFTEEEKAAEAAKRGLKATPSRQGPIIPANIRKRRAIEAAKKTAKEVGNSPAAPLSNKPTEEPRKIGRFAIRQKDGKFEVLKKAGKETVVDRTFNVFKEAQEYVRDRTEKANKPTIETVAPEKTTEAKVTIADEATAAFKEEEQAGIAPPVIKTSLLKATKRLQEEKGESELIGMMSKGTVNMLGHLRRMGQKSVDFFDVEASWVRRGMNEIGFALKNYFSRRDVEEKKGMQTAQRMQKLARDQFGGKPTRQDLVDVVLSAESAEYLNGLSAEQKAKVEPVAAMLRKYFDDSKAEFEARNLNLDFKKRMLNRLQVKLEETVDPEKRAEIEDQMAEVAQSEFVHIPYRMVFQRKLNSYLKEKDPMLRKKKHVEMRSLLAAKRHALTIKELMEKKNKNGDHIINIDDLNPVNIVMNYAYNKGQDHALLDIRDAIKGFPETFKVAKSKPKTTKEGFEWRKVTAPKLNILQTLMSKEEIKEQKAIWIRNDMYMALSDAMNTGMEQTRWDKFMAIAKMSTFWNPFLMPMYNFVQSFRSGVLNPMHPIRTAKSWKKAYKDVGGWRSILSTSPGDFSADYIEALENGLTSAPFANPFEGWREFADQINGRKPGNPITDAIRGVIYTYKKSSPIQKATVVIPLLKSMYMASWHLTWQLDELFRMQGYNYLRVKGHSPREAAQNMAKLQGDYASIPPRTRKLFNRIFFTPTFKIATIKLYAELVKSSGQVLLEIAKHPKDYKQFTTKTQRRQFYAAIGVLAVNFAFDQFMIKGLGYERDTWGRRYRKQIIDENGAKKDFYMTFASSENIIQRFAERFTKSFGDPTVDNPLKKLIQMNKWELHPVYRNLVSAVTGEGDDGRVFSDFDDNHIKLAKGLWYFTSKTFNVLDAIQQRTEYSADPKERERILKAWAKEYGTGLGEVFSIISSALGGYSYISEPKTKQFGLRLKSMQKEFTKEVYESIRRKGIIDPALVQNYKQKQREAILKFKQEQEGR